MNYKILILIFLFVYSCTVNTTNNNKIETNVQAEFFSNKGFALIFNDNLRKEKLISKKIENRSLIIFQKNLKKDTKVKITNLLNNKSILATVGSNSKYPNFYNSVVSKRIFDELELLLTEPYVQIVTVSSNSTFLAKKAKTFDEEKKVADKAPVDGISVSNLSVDKKKLKWRQRRRNLVI
tara:strand:- start:565 stop:1104 length:540 start_codon:yes stop_codon:yes gene_type:complete